MQPVVERRAHIKWQIHVGWHFISELWVNVPAYMTSVFEEALRTLTYGSIVFDTSTQYEYEVVFRPAQTNRLTGTARRMRRVVICGSSAQPPAPLDSLLRG
jgi:hypothetical protein